jgi:hypothetical protein
VRQSLDSQTRPRSGGCRSLDDRGRAVALRSLSARASFPLAVTSACGAERPGVRSGCKRLRKMSLSHPAQCDALAQPCRFPPGRTTHRHPSANLVEVQVLSSASLEPRESGPLRGKGQPPKALRTLTKEDTAVAAARPQRSKAAFVLARGRCGGNLAATKTGADVDTKQVVGAVGPVPGQSADELQETSFHSGGMASWVPSSVVRGSPVPRQVVRWLA